MPSIQIFDPARIAAILEKAAHNPKFAFGEPSNEQRRLDYLQTLASDPRNGERDLLVVDASILVELERLAIDAPNFFEVIGIVIRAATLSFLAGSPLSLPPLLLVGPPGVGNSFFARRLAEALGVPLVVHPMNLADDPGVLVGHSLSWRGARAGLLARTLIENSSASPIVFVDEIDKSLWKDHGDPLDCFHSLLEPENAENFVDAYISEVPIRAHRTFWVATANDISSALKPSLIDRFLMLRVEQPNQEGRAILLQKLYQKALEETRAPLSSTLDRATIDRLGDASPRRARLTLELAIAIAVSAQRDCLTPDDIGEGMRLAEPPVTRRIGF
ncbi:MAG: AAA family ATPase [Beijerinckiaceae bacterium]